VCVCVCVCVCGGGDWIYHISQSKCCPHSSPIHIFSFMIPNHVTQFPFSKLRKTIGKSQFPFYPFRTHSYMWVMIDFWSKVSTTLMECWMVQHTRTWYVLLHRKHLTTFKLITCTALTGEIKSLLLFSEDVYTNILHLEKQPREN